MYKHTFSIAFFDSLSLEAVAKVRYWVAARSDTEAEGIARGWIKRDWPCLYWKRMETEQISERVEIPVRNGGPYTRSRLAGIFPKVIRQLDGPDDLLLSVDAPDQEGETTMVWEKAFGRIIYDATTSTVRFEDDLPLPC